MDDFKEKQKNEFGGLQAQGTRAFLNSNSQEKHNKPSSIYNKTKKLNAQSEYFYPSGYSNQASEQNEKDEMDSLVYLSSYNRLMFGLR